MEAVSNNNENFLNKVKEEMARQFFPSEIKRATRNIEEEVDVKMKVKLLYEKMKKNFSQCVSGFSRWAEKKSEKEKWDICSDKSMIADSGIFL